MLRRRNPFWRLLLVLPVGCASHGDVHVAPDESRPHITWEIRTGGEFGDGELVCGSARPSSECVLTASTPERATLSTVHLLLHATAQPTSYLGFMRVPFIEGSAQQKGSEVNATVSPGDRPFGSSLSGQVTSKPGRYTLSISLDAMQPGMTTPMRIAQEIPVTVK